MSHYKHLSIEEREKLYLLKGQNKGVRAIAKELGRAPSTVSRELKREQGTHRPYQPSSAQRHYETRRKRCGRKRILADPKKREQIRSLIEEQHWSPEEISGRLQLEENGFQISWVSIYRAIWAGVFDGPKSHGKLPKSNRFSVKLRKKGKKRRRNDQKGKQGRLIITDRISDRPVDGNNRTVIGYFEADTVAGIQGGDSLVTMVDRCSRFTLAAKVPNAEAETVAAKMKELLEPLPKGSLKGITPDRGHEFAKYVDVIKAYPDLKFYFADPHSPWQRGTNENTNGLLREFLPKHHDMTDVPDCEIVNMIAMLNTRPRKCLAWKTPFEIFFDAVLHLT